MGSTPTGPTDGPLAREPSRWRAPLQRAALVVPSVEAVVGVTVSATLMSALPTLRYEPTGKRVRAELGGRTVVDSRRAVLVWEPRRVVPNWAVPEDDVHADLAAAAEVAPAGDDVGHRMPGRTPVRLLDPSFPFALHTVGGTSLDLQVEGATSAGAAFRPDDPDLAGLVLLDFAAMDAWWEEDVPNIGHPRDPFHRIDVLPSRRPLRVEVDGGLLARTDHPTLLFETLLPTRHYVAREDVLAELEPSSRTSVCAYKGRASYWTARVGDQVHRDIAWSYDEPFAEAAGIRGMLAFFDERVTTTLDSRSEDRPVTPWS